MNKTKIPWCDYTWNPIVGCNRNCWYCYAKGIFERSHPGEKYEDIHIYQERFQDPDMRNKKPMRIFVGSMTDIMDSRIPVEVVDKVFETARIHPQHTYIFLTKHYFAYDVLVEEVSDNCWMGITITGQEPLHEKLTKVDYLIKKSPGKIKFISFEPLLGEVAHLLKPGIDWIIIGGLSGIKGPGYEGNKIHIADILAHANLFKIPVYVKPNLKWRPDITDTNKYKNFPECKLDTHPELW